MEDILVPIALFSMIVLIVYFTSKYNYQTKKLILEKGGNVELPKRRFPFLEIGGIILGIGFGLGISVLFKSSNLNEDTQNILTGACVLFFGGAGLISGYFTRRKIDKGRA